LRLEKLHTENALFENVLKTPAKRRHFLQIIKKCQKQTTKPWKTPKNSKEAPQKTTFLDKCGRGHGKWQKPNFYDPPSKDNK